MSSLSVIIFNSIGIFIFQAIISTSRPYESCQRCMECTLSRVHKQVTNLQMDVPLSRPEPFLTPFLHLLLYNFKHFQKQSQDPQK